MPRRKVLIVTSAAVFTALRDVTIVNIAFPISAGLFPHDSLGDLSWILNGYNIVFAAALVPGQGAGGRGRGVGRRAGASPRRSPAVTRAAPTRPAPVGWPRPSVTVVAMAPW